MALKSVLLPKHVPELVLLFADAGQTSSDGDKYSQVNDGQQRQ